MVGFDSGFSEGFTGAEAGSGMPTRSTLLAAIARDIGWPTGSISSGSATNAVLANHIGSFGDDAALTGWTIIMPGATTSADQERTIEHWDDSEGSATWVRGRTDVAYSNETYFLVPPGDYTRQDIYTAINDSLEKTRTTVTTILPTIENERYYRLTDLTWLRTMQDVDAVYIRNSPNLIDNSQFDVWGDGPADDPTSWVSGGIGTSVARTSTNVARGGYGLVLTRTGADALLTQTVGLLNGQLAGKTITAAAWVRATVASRARIGINDGLTITYSSYHTGGGGDELLTVSKALSASATNLQFFLVVDSGDTSATFSNVVAVEASTIPDQLTATGESAYRMREEPGLRVRQLGTQIAVETPYSLGRGAQLVVYSAMPYPTLDSDTDTTLCPEDVIVPGAVYELTSRMRKGQDRTRLELLMARRRQEYIALSRPLREYPVINTRSPVQVMGA